MDIQEKSHAQIQELIANNILKAVNKIVQIIAPIKEIVSMVLANANLEEKAVIVVKSELKIQDLALVKNTQVDLHPALDHQAEVHHRDQDLPLVVEVLLVQDPLVEDHHLVQDHLQDLDLLLEAVVHLAQDHRVMSGGKVEE